MKTACLLSAVVGLMVAADAPQADPKDELKKFEGTWTLVSGDTDGKEVTPEQIKASKLTIAGDKHTVVIGDVKMVGTHKVDGSKKPCTIDVTDTEGPYKDKTLLGIYEFDGDSFKICFAAPGKDRPAKFSTKDGAAIINHVWKKAK